MQAGGGDKGGGGGSAGGPMQQSPQSRQPRTLTKVAHGREGWSPHVSWPHGLLQPSARAVWLAIGETSPSDK